ncbi:hypothetical protein GH733_011887 [Mirounga leonina]|nr:hypothetical protein GH733_011887 [Mirounga leonina]
MSTVKPLTEPAPSEDVIDTKPEPDDLIDEDRNFVQENPLSQKKPTVTLAYGVLLVLLLKFINHLQVEMQIQQPSSIHAAKPPDIQNSWVFETGRLCELEMLNSLEETYSPFFRNNSEKNEY